MSTLSKISILASLLALAVAPLSAAVESMKIEPTVKPAMTAGMRSDGITSGRVSIAIAVDADGRLTDSLVLGYTHRGLARNCVDALKYWRFTPARVDGVSVPTQAEITIDYTAEGVVVSHTTVSDMIEAYLRRLNPDPMVKALCSSTRLDARPTAVSAPLPKYAEEAKRDGVAGVVQVHFYIDETGTVRMPAVAPGPHPYLCNVAVEAVKDWKFQPPTSKGKPVLVAARQDFTFGK